MFVKRIGLILIAGFLFGSFTLCAQDVDLRTFNYARADSIALHFPPGKYKTYAEVVEPLTLNLHTEQEKFRAIYRWITDNITYSFSNNSVDAGRAFTQRKAVCGGYSALLKEMCNEAGIACYVIDGWAKNAPGDIGQITDATSHAWNEVNLNGKWYLTDVTWASGTYDVSKGKFHKNFDNAYFLPTPQFFIKQHFPYDDRMQMLDTLVTESDFSKSCVWYEGADKYGFRVAAPQKGCISQNARKYFTTTLDIEKPFSANDTIQPFYAVVEGAKDNQTLVCEKSIHYDASTNRYTIAVKCLFPSDIRGQQTVNFFYGADAISGFMINFH